MCVCVFVCVCVCVCVPPSVAVFVRVISMCVVLDRLLFVHAVCFLDGVQK